MAEPIRVLILTMFEREFDPWNRQFGFTEVVRHRGEAPDMLLDREHGILLAMVGVGATEAAASTMSIGLDDRFDFGEAFVLLTGIGGGNPDVVQVGSVVVGDAILDTDLANELDAREMPDEWSFGRVPLFRKKPFETPPGPNRGEVMYLDAAVVEQVKSLARRPRLVDSPVLENLRREYADWPEAGGRPQVVQGAVVAGSTLWHGTFLNDWASAWTDYWTSGRCRFGASSMEDAGIATALRHLAAMNRLDAGRAVVLRGICNFTVQPSHLSAADSLAREQASNYSAIGPAVENVYRVASAVARGLAVAP